MRWKKIVTFSAVAAVALHAQTTTLEPIVTVSTATKTSQATDSVAASVVVIDAAQIARSGSESLKGILQGIPGLHLQYGTFPSASSASKSSVSLRGLGPKGTLFLVDGRRLSGEVANPYDLDRIPASQIERIEIVKGPMSTLYGADAMGGVINIITKKPTSTPQLDVGVRYGQNTSGEDKSKNAYAAVRGMHEAWRYSAYADVTHTTPFYQYEDADVYARAGVNRVKPSAHPNSNISGNLQDAYANQPVSYREKSEVYTLGGRIGYEFDNAMVLGVEVNHFDETRWGSYVSYFHPTAFTIPAFNVPVDSKDDNTRTDVGIDLAVPVNDALHVTLRAYQSAYKKRSSVTARYWADMGYASQADSAQNGMDANVDVTTYEALANYLVHEDHLLTLGAERRFETREGTVFGLGNEMGKKKLNYSAFYAQDEWEVAEDWRIIMGARYDAISNADNKTTFKLGTVKRLSDALHVRASVAQGYRTPDIRELYIFKNTPAGAQRGADVVDASVGKLSAYDLQPEFSTSYEVGASGALGVGRYDVSVFYNDIEDKITEVNKGAYFTFENIPKAHTYGLELAWTQPFLEKGTVRLHWTQMQSKDEQSKKELAFVPKTVAGASVDYAFTQQFSAGLDLVHTGKQFYEKTLNRGTPTETLVDAHTKAYTTLDLRVAYALKKDLTWFAGLRNLTDATVEDVLGSSSGRYVYTGLRMAL